MSRRDRDMSNIDRQVSNYAKLAQLAMAHFQPNGGETIKDLNIFHTDSATGRTKFRMYLVTENSGMWSVIVIFGAVELVPWKIEQIEGRAQPRPGQGPFEPWKYDRITSHSSFLDAAGKISNSIVWAKKNNSDNPKLQQDVSNRVFATFTGISEPAAMAAHSIANIPLMVEGKAWSGDW